MKARYKRSPELASRRSITLRLSPELLARIDAYAAATEQTRQDVMVDCLDYELQKREGAL